MKASIYKEETYKLSAFLGWMDESLSQGIILADSAKNNKELAKVVRAAYLSDSSAFVASSLMDDILPTVTGDLVPRVITAIERVLYIFNSGCNNLPRPTCLRSSMTHDHIHFETGHRYD